MLECPVCSQRVWPPDNGDGFECPACRSWIQRRVTLVPAAVQGQRAPSAARRVNQPPTPSNINQMDLPAVQAERSRIETRLRALEAEIQRVSRARTQNPTSDQLRRFNTELGQYIDEQNRLQDRDQRLQERVTALEMEQARARQARSSLPGIAFVFGFLLAGGVIYTFTQMINLSLDPRAIGVAALISIGTGFLTFILSLFL